MEKEKKDLGGWWMWILALFILTVVTFGVLSYAGLLGRTVAERVIFENSFQYTEARKTEIATFEAQLTEISRKINSSNVNEQTKSNLEAQAAGLRIQLQVARGK